MEEKAMDGLNKAVEYVYFIPAEADNNVMYQAFPYYEINRNPCHGAGFEDYG